MTVAVAHTGRTGEWRADPGLGIYVHIPFCRHRCHYCDFNTYEGQDALHVRYIDALIAHVGRARHETRPATSVFFGGGTPTLLPARELGRVLDAIRKRIGIVADAEITVEANPETVDERAFGELLEAGFNRFSIGVQSLVPHVLAGLGRTHSPARALAAVRAARAAGVEDLNLDLIYGSPWEGTDDWVTSLEGAVEAGPDHLSAYALTVEDGTPLATLVATGRVPDVDPDVQADRHGIACDLLAAAGFDRYEISNWARPGRASRHNTLYWCAGDYQAFGAGAHGHLEGRRYWLVRLPRDYCAAVERGRNPEAGAESLDPDRRAAEALVLGLRLASGVDTRAFGARFGASCLASRSGALRGLAGAGLVEIEGESIRLSGRGTLLASEVGAALL